MPAIQCPLIGGFFKGEALGIIIALCPLYCRRALFGVLVNSGFTVCRVVVKCVFTDCESFGRYWSSRLLESINCGTL